MDRRTDEGRERKRWNRVDEGRKSELEGREVLSEGEESRRGDGQKTEEPTRVCWYLRAFLCDASAAIDTLSLIQK